MKLASDPQSVIAHIVALRAEAAATPAEGAAVPEPEVAKKGKKDEAPAADDKGKKPAEGKKK
jgi:hypothetical protein